jgi:hypothetical protein
VEDRGERGVRAREKKRLSEDGERSRGNEVVLESASSERVSWAKAIEQVLRIALIPPSPSHPFLIHITRLPNIRAAF